MKKRLNALALAAVFASTAYLMGCGGDNDNNTSVITPSGGTTTGFAPDSVAGQMVQLTSSQAGAAPESVTFNNDGTYSQTSGTNTTSGTFTYNKTSNNTATLVTTENGTSTVTTVQLTFNSASSGTYTFNASNGQTGSGTFTTTTSGGTTTPPTTGGGTTSTNMPPTGGGTTNTPPTGGTGGPAVAPTSLVGHTMNISASTGPFAGSSYDIEFNSASTFSSTSLSATGNYTWTPSGANANLVLNYTTGSGDVAGSQDNLNITFTSSTEGTFSGTTTPKNGTAQSFSGTIKLQ